jgi:hypothetical protein
MTGAHRDSDATHNRSRSTRCSAACRRTKEVFEESFRWIAERGIFPEGEMGAGNYEAAVISLATA